MSRTLRDFNPTLADKIERQINERKERLAYVELFGLVENMLCPECDGPMSHGWRPLDSTDQSGVYRHCSSCGETFRWDETALHRELIADHRSSYGTD